MAICEQCQGDGGMVYCKLLDRNIPTAGDGLPVKPDGCPNDEITDEACDFLPPFNPPPATLYKADSNS